MCIRIRYRGILRRWSWIRYRGILSLRIGIDACGGGCIRLSYNRSRSIGRDGSSSCRCQYRCRGNRSRKIGRGSSGFWNKYRGGSSSGGCWNMRRVNMSRVNRSRMIVRDTSVSIGRDGSSSCRCQYRCSGWEINWNWN